MISPGLPRTGGLTACMRRSTETSCALECLCEMLYCPEVPAKVAINEALELAKRYSTAQSSRFCQRHPRPRAAMAHSRGQRLTLSKRLDQTR